MWYSECFAARFRLGYTERSYKNEFRGESSERGVKGRRALRRCRLLRIIPKIFRKIPEAGGLPRKNEGATTKQKGFHMPSADNYAAAVAIESETREQQLKRLTAHCQSYSGSDLKRSVFQLVSTALLFFASLAAMYWAVMTGNWLLYALLLPPTGALTVRMFIMQHDCGHGSFFDSRKANTWTGRFISLFTFIPYDMWRRAHNIHHAGSGNLDRRGAGAVDTLTVDEYKALPIWRKRLYRLYRHPLMLLVFGPPVYIFVMLRFPLPQSAPFMHEFHAISTKGTIASVMLLNLSILLFYGAAWYLLGWQSVMLVYIPVLATGFWFGQWLFYIQHQYEDTYWRHQKDWSYAEAALMGSSWYALHPVLHWFTGNIGYHHIHHLCSGIPNYKLPECHNAEPDLSKVNRITLSSGWKSIWLVLWDEEKKKMVRFSDLKTA